MGFFLQILVRNRESILVILVSALESGPHNPPIFFFSGVTPPPPHAHSALRVEGTVVHVWLTQRELVFKFQMREMNDNFFENGILSTQYLTLTFSISVLLSAWFEWMPHFTFCCQWRSIFFFSKRKSYMWRQLRIELFLHFCLNIMRLKYKGYRFSSWKATSEMLRHVKIQIFICFGIRRRPPYFLTEINSKQSILCDAKWSCETKAFDA